MSDYTKTNKKIEIRKYCKTCGKKITKKRFRTFCSKKCRNKFYSIKNKEKQTERAKQNRDKKASIPSKNKKQCLICGKWYVQVCSHVVQRHGLTAREYKELYDLEVKKGIVPDWYRKMKGEMALENKTYKNLENGKRYWFKKGQKGVGKYKRSHITIERLRDLHKFRKNYK